MDVPEPNTVNSRTEFAAGPGSAEPQFVRRFNPYGEQHVAQLAEVAKKPESASFRGMLRAEESLFVCAFTPKKIPHFVRNGGRDLYAQRLRLDVHPC